MTRSRQGPSPVTEPLTVICWKWRQRGYRKIYGAAHVNVLARMVARHYPHPHRFVCITDDPAGVECETYPLWDDLSTIKNQCGAHLPSCYRRLRLFSEEMGAVFGPRMVSIDLDCVVTGDLTPLWNRPDSFVGWGLPGTIHERVYNGSMWLLRAGAHTPVWDWFDPEGSPLMAREMGYMGSDQAWMSFCLGRRAAWQHADGVYSWPRDLKKAGGALPDDARIVFFHGRDLPWARVLARRHPWIAEHWR